MTRFCWLGFCALVVSCVLAPHARAQEVLEDYVVREGDTCLSIARARFGGMRNLDRVHAPNPQLGRSPHHLVAGQILHLPRATAAVGPPARVTAVRRRVEAQDAGQADWEPARIGRNVEGGARVATREESSANLTLRDTTIVHLREDTLVIVHLAPAGATRTAGSEAHLERGTLRSRLGALAGGPPLRIDTATSITDLTSGTALVSVDPANATRVANHGGGAARVRGRSGGPVVNVAVGMGSKVQQGQRPSRPRPLPATPVWTSTAAEVLSLGGASGVLTASWGAVAAAARYRIEVTRDGEEMQAVEVLAPITQIELRNLTPARHELVVSAIDNDAFESIPSPAMIALVRAIGVSPTPLPDTGAGPIVLAPRSRLAAAAGPCTVDGAAHDAEAPLHSGTHALACAGAAGPSAPAAIDVLAFDAHLLAGTAPELSTEREVEFVVEVDTGGRAELALEAAAGEGVTLVSSRRDGNQFVIVARANRRPVPGTSGEISFRTAGAHSVTVGSVQLPFAATASPTTRVTETTPGALPPGSGGCAGCTVAQSGGRDALWCALIGLFVAAGIRRRGTRLR